MEERDKEKEINIAVLRIIELKVQIFDILEKQEKHQSAIKRLEQEKVKLLEEMNKLRDNNSG